MKCIICERDHMSGAVMKGKFVCKECIAELTYYSKETKKYEV